MIIRYANKRLWRVGIVYAASRMASKMLASYKPYIEFKTGPLAVSFLHPVSCFNLLQDFPSFHLKERKKE